ncbi:unnamed protein product [Penicillium egyptiacum]|uniref:HAT C-terminal dimerisation domain-containing protein n=1 Tax=Penicillium egyptiacum TaxID=1303716 RepID=A0A9W4P111_9EURO|nr:unnamed protein product [Penicillium egyptiacum]
MRLLERHQHEWPVHTRLARDLFTVPATGAGTERLFTVTQEICHARGEYLDESTIQDLVMYAYSEESGTGKQLISRVERNKASNEEWEEFETEAERPERISEDEWSPAEASIDVRPWEDENSEADTVILESAPTDDLGQNMADEARRTRFCLHLSRGSSIAFEGDSQAE